MSAPTHTDQHRSGRRVPRAATAGAAAWLVAFACAGATAQDDDVDLEPPLIEHEVLPEADAASRQSFVAQVVDDRELASVRLYWRHAGETRFEPLPMGRVSSSSTWIAEVATEPDETRSIEYWIEARDRGGNRTVRGFAFSPLVRRVLAPPGAVASGDGTGSSGPARPRESRRGVPGGAPGAEPGQAPARRTALWVVLGALGAALVVGLAASGGGGGGGGSGGGCGDDGCEVTITFDPPVAP